MAAVVASGIFRGICVSSYDPLGLGRIQVRVPQVLGPSTSGWAYPAWGMHETSIMPQDRLPVPGQGVWVIMEGDKISWFAVFGEQEFPPVETPKLYEPKIAWSLPVLPLGVQVTISGSITSPAGVPNPAPVAIGLWGLVGAVWSKLDSVDADRSGTFSFQHTRTDQTKYQIRFEGTGAFLEEVSDQRTPPDPPGVTTLLWTPPTATWRVAENVTGTCTSTTTVAGQLVRLYVRDTGSWAEEGTGVVQNNGTFSIPWTRERTGAIETKAVFPGSSQSSYKETAVAPSVAVSVPVTATLNLGTMAMGVAGTISGTTLTSIYGPPPGVVQFQTRTPTLGTGAGGTWVNTRAITPVADGSFSFSYTPDLPDADYRMEYVANGVYQGATTVPQYRFLAMTTTTTLTVPGTLVHGTAASFTGTVRDSLGANLTSGTVELWRRRTTGTTTWAKEAQASVVNGAFTIAHTPVVVGANEWYATFTGVPGKLAGTSATTARTVDLGTVALTKGSVSYTSATMSWGGISGAASYEWYIVGGQFQPYHVNIGNVATASATGLYNVTDYTFYVRALAADTAGTTIYGAWSSSITCYTGRAESRNKGSIADVIVYSTKTATYRPSDAWAYNGSELAQGYYSAAANIGFGTITYDGPAFRAWLDATYGAGVAAKFSFSKLEVAIYRIAGGTGGAVSCWWYVSGATAGTGGQPPLAGGSAFGSFTPGTSGWCNFAGAAHWAKHVLWNESVPGAGVCKSLVLYRNNSTEYAKFGGKGYQGNSTNMRVAGSWDFVTMSYVAPKWY